MLGQTISHYRVIEKLGEGGMGEVYLADDTSLERKVALKFLPMNLQDDEVAHRRFLREARSAAALDHPFICNIHEVAETEDGRDFIVMEYVEGLTLQDKLAEGPLPLKEALRIATEVAEALEKAHSVGIIHRDLKPSNIMLTADGHPKVMDFGLAKKVVRDDGTEQDISSALTREGSTLGTPAYMSPEQVKSDPVDHRSDIFSFGIVLYEMLTGVHPFRKARTVETTAAILEKEPAPLARYAEEIPELLSHTVSKMLSKTSEARYQSVHEVGTNLRELSVEVTKPFEVVRPAKRRASGLLVSLAVLGFVLATIIVYWGWNTLDHPGPTSGQRRTSIAVLPLENLSAEPESDYFSDGLTEDITAQLSKISDLKVISRTSVMVCKNTEKSSRQIGQELGVATILEGSVRRANGRVRVVAQLIDAERDEHIWAETYDRQLDDIFAIQSEVAERIAAALEAELTPAEKVRIETKPTDKLEAYNLYLQARFLRKEDTGESILRAIDYLERAIDIDPKFAQAYGFLARCYQQAGSSILGRREKADAAARKALELDPTVGIAHTTLGSNLLFRDWDWAGAEKEYRKAVELDPGDSGVRRQWGLQLFRMGRLGEAEKEYLIARDLDPLWQTIRNYLALINIRRGDLDAAMEIALGMLKLDPREYRAHRRVGDIYRTLADYERAEAAYKKIAEYKPARIPSGLSLIRNYLTQGKLEEAREATPPGRPAMAGLVASWAGDFQKVREHCENAIEASPGHMFLLSRDEMELPTFYLLAHALIQLDDQVAAEDLMNQTLERDHQWLEAGDESYLSPLGIAYVHSIRGEQQEALRWLQQAIDRGWRLCDYARKDPLFENLHGEPRFQQMMTEVEAKLEEMRPRVRDVEESWQ